MELQQRFGVNSKFQNYVQTISDKASHISALYFNSSYGLVFNTGDAVVRYIPLKYITTV